MPIVPDTFQTFNSKAKIYQERFMEEQTYNASYDAFLARIPGHETRILDIACGPGMISRYILQCMPEGRIIGIDFAPAMIELARVNVPEAEFRVCDVRDVSSVKGSFEGVISGFVLHYLSPSDCRNLLADCRRLIVPGAAFYFSLIAGKDEGPVVTQSSDGTAACNIYYHSVETLRNWLGELGMDVQEEVYFPGEAYLGQVALIGKAE